LKPAQPEESAKRKRVRTKANQKGGHGDKTEDDVCGRGTPRWRFLADIYIGLLSFARAFLWREELD
jgi:hypothetical protein